MKTKISMIFFLMCSLSISYAQTRQSNTEGRMDDSKFWYGGGFGIGFQSTLNRNSFALGLYPMLGYKIIPNLSVGPRLGVQYQYIRVRGVDGKYYNFHPIEVSGAAFTRFKFSPVIFAHAEFELINQKGVTAGSNGLPTGISNVEQNLYLGGGYNSGSKFAYEFYVLYNVLEKNNLTLQQPLSFRGGFTYNF